MTFLKRSSGISVCEGYRLEAFYSARRFILAQLAFRMFKSVRILHWTMDLKKSETRYMNEG